MLMKYVGISASNNDVDSLLRLLLFIPTNTGAVFIVVIDDQQNEVSKHIDAIAINTSMPVLEIAQGTEIDVNHINVAPSDSVLTLTDDHFLLTAPRKGKSRNAMADPLFGSLASSVKANSVGVVFRNARRSNAVGSVDIHQAGGAILVQNTDETATGEFVENSDTDMHIDAEGTPEELANILLNHLARD